MQKNRKEKGKAVLKRIAAVVVAFAVAIVLIQISGTAKAKEKEIYKTEERADEAFTKEKNSRKGNKTPLLARKNDLQFFPAGLRDERTVRMVSAATVFLLGFLSFCMKITRKRDEKEEERKKE